MVLVVLFLYFNVFTFMLDRNTAFEDTSSQVKQMDIDRSTEQVTILNPLFEVYPVGQVALTCTINNTGPLSVQLVRLWVKDLTNKQYGNVTITTPPIILQPGDIQRFSLVVNIPGVSPTEKNFTFWFVTARGNTVSVATPQQITISAVVGGIGSIILNFDDFKYFNVTKKGLSYMLDKYPNSGSAYHLQGTNEPKGQIAFRVILTNLDKNQRNIVLIDGSELFLMYPKRGSFQEDVWYIVNVNEATGAISNTYTPITLQYNVPTPVYFASVSRGTFAVAGTTYTGIAPVNLALVGQIGGSPFGQNIPFVSIEVVS
jgi:hypothetical protein